MATPRDLQRRPKPLHVCGVCGVEFGPRVAATKDHIVPRGFFGTQPPPNLPTWRVCTPCQQDLSPREDRLCTLFAAGHSHHPELIRDLTEKTTRSTQRPEIIGRRHVAAPSGVLVPAWIAVPRQDDLDRVFGKIARGLYYWRNGRTAGDPRWAVRLPNDRDFAALAVTAVEAGAGPVQRLGAEFWWITYCCDSERAWCLWLFVVFAAIPVVVFYGQARDDLPIPRPSGIALR